MLPAITTKKKRSFSIVVLALFLAGIMPLLLGGTQAGRRLWHATLLRSNFQEWEALDTEYFYLRYPAKEADFVQWWAREADEAARKVNEIFQYRAKKKPWLVIVPDQATMQKVFGWSDSTHALGVYQADTILLLSPQAWNWLPQGRQISVFAAENPLIHEYTHFVLDNEAKAFYPRWFSEGLAQLLAYRLQGYVWVDEESLVGTEVFPPPELERSFDKVETQEVAYGQALSMVTFLAELQGMEGLHAVIKLLAQGRNFYKALAQVYALEENEFFLLWRQWWQENPHWLSRGV